MSAAGNVIGPEAIEAWAQANFPDTLWLDSWGERAAFYNPGRRFPRGAYFLTLKQKDGEHDRASRLDRQGIYRLNFSLQPARYEAMFGRRPARPAKGGVVAGDCDFTASDVLMPHPVYAWMGWVCILNPDQARLSMLEQLVGQSYQRARKTLARREKAKA